MKISESRALLRSTAANAGDKTSFSDDALDNTTRMIGNDLAKRADATLITTAIVLSQGSDALPVIHADFRAERLRHEPYLTGSNVAAGGRLRQPRRTGDKTGQVEVWDYLDLNDWALRGGGTQAGQPEAIAFPSSAAVGRCYPVPDDDYTLNIPWVPPFLAWYPGVALALATVSGGAVTAIQVISGGANYLSAPSVSFSGGGGSGATATAAVSAGRVTGFTVGAGGTGYTAAPSVLLNT
ncbi:MAG TPA: hypothetical protein VHM90_02885, partial [Phycisphaerae bacterium]|nr:hypothetical protein [Phycisphaerae bacterium]